MLTGGSYTGLVDQQAVRERLTEMHGRLVRAREELAVTEEHLAALDETAEEAHVRSLVAESALADHEWRDAQRSAEAMRRGRDLARARVAELEKAQNDLLAKLVV